MLLHYSFIHPIHSLTYMDVEKILTGTHTLGLNGVNESVRIHSEFSKHNYFFLVFFPVSTLPNFIPLIYFVTPLLNWEPWCIMLLSNANLISHMKIFRLALYPAVQAFTKGRDGCIQWTYYGVTHRVICKIEWKNVIKINCNQELFPRVPHILVIMKAFP